MWTWSRNAAISSGKRKFEMNWGKVGNSSVVWHSLLKNALDARCFVLKRIYIYNTSGFAISSHFKSLPLWLYEGAYGIDNLHLEKHHQCFLYWKCDCMPSTPATQKCQTGNMISWADAQETTTCISTYHFIRIHFWWAKLYCCWSWKLSIEAKTVASSKMCTNGGQWTRKVVTST